ncbi:MAG: TIGR04197 family type VII secretion effector [Clostridium sp.]|nr:TIGR04197 family type VII secretion effector [Clostridium sp.]MCM1171649.1 TIGR04197 family type VII secretion effector [Clostridium sp.]
MSDEISLDADLIEQHYESLISGTEQCSDPVVVVYDDETNISVRYNSENAYENAVNMEKLVEKCIDADAEHLKNLGETFLIVDDNLSADINNLLSFN